MDTDRSDGATPLPQVSPEEAALRRRWAEATMTAWYGATPWERREAQERADALWNALLAYGTPKAEGADLGLRASGSGETREPD